MKSQAFNTWPHNAKLIAGLLKLFVDGISFSPCSVNILSTFTVRQQALIDIVSHDHYSPGTELTNTLARFRGKEDGIFSAPLGQ